MMGRFGIPEDQPIENRFIGRSLEGAQAKIEGFHFGARKIRLNTACDEPSAQSYL